MDSTPITERNPPWAPPLNKREIQRLYSADARGLIDEELINEVGYGLLARCESILVATEAQRGRVACPRCREIVYHSRNADDILVCNQCDWRMTWPDYRASLRRKHLKAGGIEPFVRDYIKQFPKASQPRQKMVLIDRLIHRWHWEHKDALQRPAAANLIEGNARDAVEFLDSLSYSEKSTPGLSAGYEDWRRKHQTAAERLYGDLESIFVRLRSSDAEERRNALKGLEDIGADIEAVIKHIIQALHDPNRKNRRSAIYQLMNLDIDEERKTREFIPLLLPLLHDPSGRVRRTTANFLAETWAMHVPLSTAVRALLDSHDNIVRKDMEVLVRAVLNSEAEML